MTRIQSLIRTIPDHPRPGLQFRDVTTLLKDPVGVRFAVDGIADRRQESVDVIAGIEARGFILGTAEGSDRGLQ